MAVETMPCPVIANGNVVDVTTGLSYLEKTGAAGLMVGRGAIRNPWIFAQLLAAFTDTSAPTPTYRELWEYIQELSDELARETPKFHPLAHVQRMKKTMAYISHGLEGEFEYDMRRMKTPVDFHEICQRHLDCDAPLPERPPVGSKLFCGFEELV
jgi:tRNA-dihydrouridine synthase